MLAGHFYSIEKLAADNNMLKAVITFDARHAIFEGHFPGQPIVPGVCMLQIVKETLEEKEQKKVFLVKADSLKFLSMIDPGQTVSVILELKYSVQTDGSIKADAQLLNEGVFYFKFKGSFKESY